MKLLVLLSLFLQDGLSEAAKKANKDLESIREGIKKLVELDAKAKELNQELETAILSEEKRRVERLEKKLDDLRKEFDVVEKKSRGSLDTYIESRTAELKGAPRDWGLLEARGHAWLLKGDPEKGAEDLQASLKIKPGRTKTELVLGKVFHGINRYEDALKHLKSVLKADPSNNEARAFTGMCEFSLNRFEDALGQLEIALPNIDKLGKRVARYVRRCHKWSGDLQPVWAKEQERRVAEVKAGDLPRVKFTTSKGVIIIELFENEAPNTVANFVSLVEMKFYDGTRFHRVIPNFMAQGGDPNSKDDDPSNDGNGGPGYRIADECRKEPYRRHFRGTISMANEGPDTNGSQFFINHLPSPWLNGKHTVFGRVIEGLDVLDRLRLGDELKTVEVVRKRDHKYEPKKLDR